MTIEITPQIELDSAIYPAGSSSAYFLPGVVELPTPAVEFATGIYFSGTGSRYFLPASFVLPAPSLEFSTGIYRYSSTNGNEATARFIPGTVVLTPIVLPPLPGDTGLQIVFTAEDGSAEVFPVLEFEPGEDVEFLYPIVPQPVVNKELHRLDNKLWKRISKSEVNQVYSTLKMRIHCNTLPFIVTFIKGNRTRLIELNTPSLYPFGDQYSRNITYIVSWTKPIRENQTYWRMEVTYLQIRGVS